VLKKSIFDRMLALGLAWCVRELAILESLDYASVFSPGGSQLGSEEQARLSLHVQELRVDEVNPVRNRRVGPRADPIRTKPKVLEDLNITLSSLDVLRVPCLVDIREASGIIGPALPDDHRTQLVGDATCRRVVRMPLREDVDAISSVVLSTVRIMLSEQQRRRTMTRVEGAEDRMLWVVLDAALRAMLLKVEVGKD
jgi:hypothetical protein